MAAVGSPWLGAWIALARALATTKSEKVGEGVRAVFERYWKERVVHTKNAEELGMEIRICRGKKPGKVTKKRGGQEVGRLQFAIDKSDAWGF